VCAHLHVISSVQPRHPSRVGGTTEVAHSSAALWLGVVLRAIMVVCVGVSAAAGISRSELAARMRGWVRRCMRLDAESDYGGVRGGQCCG